MYKVIVQSQQNSLLMVTIYRLRNNSEFTERLGSSLLLSWGDIYFNIYIYILKSVKFKNLIRNLEGLSGIRFN
jgi:hypothetical protein